MDSLVAQIGPEGIGAIALILGFAGFVKGAVGFALPMLTISLVGSLYWAELAVAALILPSLFTNIWQTFRDGVGAARASFVRYWRLSLVLLGTIYACAQLVTRLPGDALFVILGVGVTVFSALQLVGWRPRLDQARRYLWDVPVGLLAGFFGGLAGVWGPPILIYLLALDTPKTEMVRVQGITFLIGSVVLSVAHLRSGLLDAVTLPFSALMTIPALIGMGLGLILQNRMDQRLFRRATLMVLTLAGLNLLRRGLF